MTSSSTGAAPGAPSAPSPVSPASAEDGSGSGAATVPILRTAARSRGLAASTISGTTIGAASTTDAVNGPWPAMRKPVRPGPAHAMLMASRVTAPPTRPCRCVGASTLIVRPTREPTDGSENTTRPTATALVNSSPVDAHGIISSHATDAAATIVVGFSRFSIHPAHRPPAMPPTPAAVSTSPAETGCAPSCETPNAASNSMERPSRLTYAAKTTSTTRPLRRNTQPKPSVSSVAVLRSGLAAAAPAPLPVPVPVREAARGRGMCR